MKVTGVVERMNGRFYLTDTASRTRLELRGWDLAKFEDKPVQVTGSVILGATTSGGASQVIQVTKIEQLSAKMAAVAGISYGTATGGAAAAGGAASGAAAAGVAVGFGEDVKWPVKISGCLLGENENLYIMMEGKPPASLSYKKEFDSQRWKVVDVKGEMVDGDVEVSEMKASSKIDAKCVELAKKLDLPTPTPPPPPTPAPKATPTASAIASVGGQMVFTVPGLVEVKTTFDEKSGTTTITVVPKK